MRRLSFHSATVAREVAELNSGCSYEFVTENVNRTRTAEGQEELGRFDLQHSNWARPTLPVEATPYSMAELRAFFEKKSRAPATSPALRGLAPRSLYALPVELQAEIAAISPEIRNKFRLASRDLHAVACWEATSLRATCAQGLESIKLKIATGRYPKLRSLDVSELPDGTLRMGTLVDILRYPRCRITSLDVSGNKFSGKDACALFAALCEPQCCVTSLNLQYTELSEETVKALAATLCNKHCKLTWLDLSCCNDFSEEAASALFAALRNPRCPITSLDLRGTDITDGPIADLIAALRDPNCALTSLKLDSGMLSRENMRALADALRDPNNKLTSLELSNDEIFVSDSLDDEDVEILAEALYDPNCKLTKLDLSDNENVGAIGVQALAVALCNSNCRIAWLGLRNIAHCTRVTQALVNALSHPNCTLATLEAEGSDDVE